MILPLHEELLAAIREIWIAIAIGTLMAISEHWMERLESVSDIQKWADFTSELRPRSEMLQMNGTSCPTVTIGSQAKLP
jgi:hypothetical protein